MINPKLLIFGTVAIGAAVAAAVSAAWAGYKTSEKIQNAPEEEKPKTKTETFKATWKYWVPTGACLLVSIVSDVCLVKFGLATAAALTSAITYATVNRKKILVKAKKAMNSDEFKEFKKDITKETVKETVKFQDYGVYETGYGDTLCYLDVIDRYFRSDPIHVHKALQDLIWNLGTYDEDEQIGISLSDLLTDLGFFSKLSTVEQYAYENMYWYKDDVKDDKGTLFETEMVEGWKPGTTEECCMIHFYEIPDYVC